MRIFICLNYLDNCHDTFFIHFHPPMENILHVFYMPLGSQVSLDDAETHDPWSQDLQSWTPQDIASTNRNSPTLKGRQDIEAVAEELCPSARMASRWKLIAVSGEEDTVTGFLPRGTRELNKSRHPNSVVVEKYTTISEIKDTFQQFLTEMTTASCSSTNTSQIWCGNVLDARQCAMPAVLEILSKEHPMTLPRTPCSAGPGACSQPKTCTRTLPTATQPLLRLTMSPSLNFEPLFPIPCPFPLHWEAKYDASGLLGLCHPS